MDPKLKAKLDKEITKGKIPMDAADAEEPIDADLDMLVARSVEEVWKTYDPKGTGFMEKKMVEKFFNVRTRSQETKGRKMPTLTQRDMASSSKRNGQPSHFGVFVCGNSSRLTRINRLPLSFLSFLAFIHPILTLSIGISDSSSHFPSL